MALGAPRHGRAGVEATAWGEEVEIREGGGGKEGGRSIRYYLEPMVMAAGRSRLDEPPWRV